MHIMRNKKEETHEDKNARKAVGKFFDAIIECIFRKLFLVKIIASLISFPYYRSSTIVLDRE